MESQSPTIPFYSEQDLLLNKDTHIALNWCAGEGALEIEVYRPARVNNSAGGYLRAGTIRFSSPDARRWIQGIVESEGESDVFMHIRGDTQEKEPRKSPLVISENDRLHLTYDRAGRGMRIETPSGSFSLPLKALVEFLGQVMAYEKAVSAATRKQHAPHPNGK